VTYLVGSGSPTIEWLQSRSSCPHRIESHHHPIGLWRAPRELGVSKDSTS
jgi:hypothetical protein